MREFGFYEVVYHGRKEIAEFNDEGWYITASTACYHDDDFEYINENRIVISDKKTIINSWKIENATGPDALKSALDGCEIHREGWNGSGLKVKRLKHNNSGFVDFLYIEYPKNSKTTPGLKCPWVPSQTDLFATDWVIEYKGEAIDETN